jgi:hypothetical protein
LHARTNGGLFADTQWFAHVEQDGSVIGDNRRVETKNGICVVGEWCIMHDDVDARFAQRIAQSRMFGECTNAVWL